MSAALKRPTSVMPKSNVIDVQPSAWTGRRSPSPSSQQVARLGQSTPRNMTPVDNVDRDQIYADDKGTPVPKMDDTARSSPIEIKVKPFGTPRNGDENGGVPGGQEDRNGQPETGREKPVTPLPEPVKDENAVESVKEDPASGLPENEPAKEENAENAQKQAKTQPALPRFMPNVEEHEIEARLKQGEEPTVELPEGHIECPFKIFKCRVVGEVKAVQEHIRDDKFTHLSLMCESVLTFQRQVEVEIDRASRYLNLDEDLKRRTNANDKLFSCQMIWRIDDYTAKYKAARDGKKPLIFSRPFYSHCNGYKVICILAPYGDGEALREFLSVFISIARGDFDAMLGWPFKCPVSFTLINQKGGDNVVANLVPKAIPSNDAFLGRPTADRNPAFGLQKFLKLDEMRNGGQFIKQDTCFLKIDIDVHELSVL